MDSAIILLVCLLIAILFNAFVLAKTARVLGSPRGKLIWGILVVVLFQFIGAALILDSKSAQSHGTDYRGLLEFAVMLLLLYLLYFVMRRTFQLRVGRTFILLGVYLICSVIEGAFQAAVLKPYFVEAFAYSSAGMAPTINAGDCFVVSKLRQPRRWDIVAFHHTEREGVFVYCKRLVALPGERLSFEGGNVYVNGQPLSPPPVVAGKYDARVGKGSLKVGLYRDGQPIQLARDEVFVIGDNVPISADSRTWGPVKVSDVVGVAEFEYWPMSRIGTLH
jgi:signal peptidase I